ncbi:hypothetical protein EJ02DRAFT_411358 [Clathrospora elynae]|uniref:Uncharacterized protein n=1 Tax=Clathrospora elynae TaxID=706981 RepID=A0A6A5SEG6_9PLEO|nr:hypothetical protein EJ02DRAFT_411358 [Clathrospora elynae]
MHKISRASLAALVCPSAPFLAPRLLRVPAAVPSLQCASYASESNGKGLIRKFGGERKGKGLVRKLGGERKGKQFSKTLREPSDETARLLKQFHQACEIRNVQHVMDLYPTLLAAGALNSYDTRRITQALHVRIRNEYVESKRAALFPFVQHIAADLRSGALEPHHFAFVHLFGIYKDCKRFDDGHDFWQWLVQQDERYVSQAAYGAAIELMAYGGIMSLPDLENLYVDGLKRFPGTFAEYHLSPDAIVPDRTQPTVVAGIPTILLQGILTARILARDWKKAYLALDTALRLYPTQTPPRYFELFMTERPISEAYTAFMVACRAGVSLRPTHVTALMSKMRAAISASPSMADRMLLVHAIANALYAYLETGAQLESIHVGSFIHTFEQLLPEPIAGEDYMGDAAAMRTIIVAAAHDILSALIQAGMSPQTHPFEALISVSGKLRVPALLSTTLQDVTTAGIELGPIGTRSAITSAGLLANKDLIEQYWSRLVSAAETEGAQIPFLDWITFTKACRRADHADYFRVQLSKLQHAITSSIESHVLQQIDMAETVPASQESFEYMSIEELTSNMETLKAQMKNIEAVVMSGQPLDLRATPFYMHIDPDHPSLGSTDDLRKVYDKLTTDLHQPPPAPPAEGSPIPVALSPTGIPLDELRFQNWVTVIEMMDDAESYESDFNLALNAAIKAGLPLKGAPEVLRLRKDETKTSAAQLPERIRELRTPDIFRKIGLQALSTRKPTRSVTDRQPKREESLGTPRLTYYVGLESDHGAPHATKKRPLVRKINFSDEK